MKTLKSLLLITFFIMGMCTHAQNKTMFVYKNDATVSEITLSEIDSIKFSTPIEDGNGFTNAEIGASKEFPELGYPGELESWDTYPENSEMYGDLLMYHAYCGNYIVLLSRIYAGLDPTSPHCLKVVDKTTLNPAGDLNLGSISVADIQMITSDYKGRCVAAVVKDGETEFFYWTTPANAPTSVGKIAVNMAPAPDGSNNFQVSGDITGSAWITALAPRGTEGEHYRVKVTGGHLDSNYSMVTTGYSSSDCTGFQMISQLDASDDALYVIGDTEGEAATASSTRVYTNSLDGLTHDIMPAYWQNILQDWWVGTGFSTARTGGRAPVVSALPINGKSYVVVTTGTSWWHAAAVLTSDLQELAHPNLNIAFPMNRGWSYGAWVDWYYNAELKEAYLAVWFGRLGLFTYKLTCSE